MKIQRLLVAFAIVLFTLCCTAYAVTINSATVSGDQLTISGVGFTGSISVTLNGQDLDSSQQHAHTDRRHCESRPSGWELQVDSESRQGISVRLCRRTCHFRRSLVWRQQLGLVDNNSHFHH